MKVKSGNIPYDIVYFFSSPEKITLNPWDDGEDYAQVEESYYPVYVSEQDSAQRMESGQSWAANRAGVYDYNTGKYTITYPVQTIKLENTPKEGYRIIGMVKRYGGGRAYKVVDTEGHLFDLREDILLELMLKEGISKGGVLNGKYIWARIGAEMKLVRVGSALYEALLESGSRRMKPVIDRSKLKVGWLYESKAGNRAVFLGVVDTTTIELTVNGESYERFQRKYDRYQTPNNVLKADFKNVKNQLFWLDVGNDSLEEIQSQMTAKNIPPFRLKYSKTHSYCSEVAEVINSPIPIDVIRNNVKETYKDYYTKNYSNRINRHSYYKSTDYHKENFYASIAHLLLLRDAGTKPDYQILEGLGTLRDYIPANP